MDWSACVICQQKTSEDLKCPLDGPGSGDKTAPYKTFLTSVDAFRKIDRLPQKLCFSEGVTVKDFVEHRAKWHKSCCRKFAKDKLHRAERKRELNTDNPDSATDEKRRKDRQTLAKSSCIFCGKEEGHLHEFRTLDADENIRRMATDLQDTALLAKISGGDLIAIEAKYHLTCLTELRNRHRSKTRQFNESCESKNEEYKTEARAFIELTSSIENSVEDGIFHFRLVDLRKLYEKRLQDLGLQKEINKSRFKEKILQYFPQAQEQSDGKHSVLIFPEGMQKIVKQVMKCDHEGDAAILAKAAKIVRSDISQAAKFNFDASFPAYCQEQSVPSTLKMLVSMILNGPDVKQQDTNDSQACLTISQIILFNFKKKGLAAGKSRHSMNYETPLPLYIGLDIHTRLRSKKIVTELHELGLSVSYDRVLQLENQLATAVCLHTQKEGVVCPPQLRLGLFTVGAVDNIDHNPSSTTATGSFHGTGISLFQSPTKTNMGQPREAIKLPAPDTEQCHILPERFTTVPAVALKEGSAKVPKLASAAQSRPDTVAAGIHEEKLWLRQALELLKKEKLEKGDAIAWSAYHAALQDDSLLNDKQAALTQLMPLFHEKAATAAMIKHSMDVNRQATLFLNPGQVPVLAMDAPLYALAKYIQWKWPETYGEDQYVIMFGGLHIEMAAWKTIGDYLSKSGWTAALTQAGIASYGTADSFLRCCHLTRTRRAHQVSAVTLAKLQEDAFLSTGKPDTEEAKETWRQDMISRSPTFQFWDTVLHFELLFLLFIRAHRQANFHLYVDSLKALVPWFFSMDHHNYARWISVHLRDMENLPPMIKEEFEQHGHWVVFKTTNRFSAIPIDQAHENNNDIVKGSGGAVGLTENPSAFRKWMLAGPEQARMLKEFEASLYDGPEKKFHHEEGLSTQQSFRGQVLSLVKTISDMGNPFMNDTAELLMLDTCDVMNESVTNTVRTVEKLGKSQYDDYHKSVLTDCTRSIHDPIKKNSLPLFKCPTPKAKSKQADKIATLRADVSLFSHLYIVAQDRETDVVTLFQHENNPYPPSLADKGKLRLGKKSDLLKCLVQAPDTETPGSLETHDLDDDTDLAACLQHVDEAEDSEGELDVLYLDADLHSSIQQISVSEQLEPPLTFDTKILDGTAILHFLSTAGISTFEDYANDVFLPYIRKQLEDADRVDVVWDTYRSSSIKESAREKRGKGIRRKVAGPNKIPGKWQEFLRDSDNKEELFAFLSKKVATAEFPTGKVVAITSGQKVLIRGADHSMPDNNHEEADTKILLHLQDTLQTGSCTCLVRTVDTDVIVIITGKFHQLQALCPAANIWVAFGTGKNFTHFHINTIAHALGEEKSTALPTFHSFTGCDTVSAFFGKGKLSAWAAWKHYSEVTEAFKYVAENPFTALDANSHHFRLLERYTVVLYDKTSQLSSVDEARRQMFCHRDKISMEALPPTQAALLQHSNRAVYQASIWTTADQPQQQAPSPEGWGWTMDKDSNAWLPFWTTLPIASAACRELVKCACKGATGCGSRCGCKKGGWPCTRRCKCTCDK